MRNSWTYKQLTAAAERELRILAAKAADPDPAEQSRRAAVVHGVFMLAQSDGAVQRDAGPGPA